MKRTALFVIALLMIVLLFGCAPSGSSAVPTQPARSTATAQPAGPSASPEASVQTDEFTSRELSAATALGIVPEGMGMEGDITPKELLALLKKTVELAGGDMTGLTDNLAGNYESQTVVTRGDAALAFYLAAGAVGIDTHFVNEAGTDVIDTYASVKSNLFSNLTDSYITMDDYEKSNHQAIVCAGWFVTNQGSLVSSRPIMTSDENQKFGMGKNLTRMDAVLGAWRLITSIEPKPEYLTVDEAKALAYDKTIIPDDLLNGPSNLPDISYAKIPQYNAMCYLEKESAYNRCGKGWFSEDSIRSFSKAGINFLSVRYDFSVLNYPDYNSGKINLHELKQLDQLIAWGIKYGVHISIEGNGLANQGGYPRGLHKYDMDTQLEPLDAICKGDKAKQKEFQAYWEVLAKRYAAIPAKYLSFNLLAEINSPDEKTYVSTFLPVAEAIRAYNKDRVVFAYGNVGQVFDGLAAYGYPLAWSNFYPDMYAQIGKTEAHPLYDQTWESWFLNGSIGADAAGPRKVDIRLQTDIASATFALCNASSYTWGPSKGSAPAPFVISADGMVLKKGSLPVGDSWTSVTVQIPAGTKTLTLLAKGNNSYFTFDGIVLKKADGTEFKIVPTTYDYPNASVPSATVTVGADGKVSTDVPMTFDLLLAQDDLSQYLKIANKNNVGIIVAEWGPTANASRTKPDNLAYFKLYADGYRKLGITAAPSRTPGFPFSTLVCMTDLPGDFLTNPSRYVPVGGGSSYYIDTWEVQALTGKPYQN